MVGICIFHLKTCAERVVKKLFLRDLNESLSVRLLQWNVYTVNMHWPQQRRMVLLQHGSGKDPAPDASWNHWWGNCSTPALSHGPNVYSCADSSMPFVRSGSTITIIAYPGNASSTLLERVVNRLERGELLRASRMGTGPRHPHFIRRIRQIGLRSVPSQRMD